MELVGRKLKLKPGMRVLELGCGWGGLCKYLAETYQVHMTGVTISKEGAKYGQELCKDLPVEIRCCDYRDVTGNFDAVVAIGILEHVGRLNYRSFFELAHRCLPQNGIFLCHSIGIDSDDVAPVEPWFNKYIFPGGILPDHRDITHSIHNLFTIEDWHNFGADYDRTLMAWHANFVRNWSKISHLFDEPERFFRIWSYYLLACAGIFRSRKYHLWQIVLSKGGIPGGYESVR
jgi:cyclopropane-fatty-acyl-phospholipid synthase